MLHNCSPLRSSKISVAPVLDLTRDARIVHSSMVVAWYQYCRVIYRRRSGGSTQISFQTARSSTHPVAKVTARTMPVTRVIVSEVGS